jgi:hypothetical protein
MITIFCDFRRKKWSFSQKTTVMITVLNNLALFRVKNANFSPNFSAKIFKKSEVVERQ